MHIPFIWRHTVYTWHTPTQNFQGHFGTCHVMVWSWNIPGLWKFWVVVCKVYTVYRHMKGICMFYTRYIPDIYYWSIFISGVCLVYRIYMFTWNLSPQWCYILGICLVYTIDICGIYWFYQWNILTLLMEYTNFINGIYLLYPYNILSLCMVYNKFLGGI